jgi:hypothetical protein
VRPLLRTLLALAVAVEAAATTVTLQRDGVRVDEGEICRFAAGDRDNPFQRWLLAADLTCVRASEPVTFPSGLWNVFARAGESAVSSAPLLVDGDAAPATLSLSLDPAATVSALLAAGQRGVVYAPRRAVAYPITQPRVIVPAGEELWLFVLEKTTPIALLPIAAIEVATTRTVDARSGGPSSVVGWLEVPEGERAALRDVRGVDPPDIRASSGGQTRTADPLPPFERLHGAFVRIRDVAAGDTELEIAGRGWIPHRRRAKVAASLSMAGGSLLVRGASTLVVNWSTAENLRALDDSVGSCGTSEKLPQFTIAISACSPGRPGEPLDTSSCSVVREGVLPHDVTFGALTVEDVAPGTYRAELRYGKLPPASGVVTVAAFQQRPLRVHAMYYTLYGGVTLGGQPLGEDAVLEFPGGIGFASAESGEYRAVLRSAILGSDAQITVAACDGSPRAVVLSDRLLRSNTRFDIDIPANELLITVSDTFTRMPLTGAAVRFNVMSRSLPRRVVLARTLATADDDAGQSRLVIEFVPEREIHLSISHPGYQKQDIEPFSMTKSEKKTLDVQLVPLRGNRGKILSQRPFENGAVYWYSAGGAETERAELAPDGTFIHANWHGPDETMTVVSQSHPIWTSMTPNLERRQTLEVRFPDAPVREVEVSVRKGDPRDMRHVGVSVGSLRIPQPALRQHLFLRGLPPTIRGAGPMRIRDIAETGPIDILLGPTVAELSARAAGMDLFALPQFAESPRQRLKPGATTVVFEP